MIIKVLNFSFRILLVSIAVYCIFSCKEQKPHTSASDMAKVNPFDTSHFETQALSAEDRLKLANATGKTLKPISVDALTDKINTSTNRLHLYCFWTLENVNSIQTLKAAHSLSTKFDTTQLKIVFVNMPTRQNIDDVNLFIRENQLTEETLVLEKADVSFFSKKIRKDFGGVTALPVILMVNKAEETLLFYNKSMDEKELSALVQPLVL